MKEILPENVEDFNMASTSTDSPRDKALVDYRKKLMEHKELDARLKDSKIHNEPFFAVHRRIRTPFVV